MLYHVLLFFYHNRSHSPSKWPKICYIKNAKVITLFLFFVLVNQGKKQNPHPYMKKNLSQQLEKAQLRRPLVGRLAQRAR